MRVNILSYEPTGGWILYDYAEKLAAAMRPYVDAVEITHDQHPGFDVTFHVNYAGLRELKVPGLHSTMVTHIDFAEKFALVRAQAAAGVWGFCMSEETTRRMNTLTGIGRFVSFPPPAMIDAPRRSKSVLIAARTYLDGRKNEGWMMEFIREFPPAMLKVNIIGGGWTPYVDELRSAGYEVDYREQFARETYLELLAASDYLLVAGFDEGALSTLDAILYDVVPIATAQGYHLEQQGEMRLFSTREQLIQIAKTIISSVERANTISREMTDWDRFARKHIEKWRDLLASS
jgi:hypothetical protein